MEYMFNGAKSFNSDISKWNVSNVYSLDSIFDGATSFTTDISNWDISKALEFHLYGRRKVIHEN